MNSLQRLIGNFVATIVGFIAAGSILGFFMEPGDELSTWGWIFCLVVGTPIVIGGVLLFGTSTRSTFSCDKPGEDFRD